MNIARYGVLSHYPHPNRTEHVNIGIVVFRPTGETRLHLDGNLRKLRAIDPSADIETARQWEADLPRMLEGCDMAQSIQRIRALLGTWRLSETLGAFRYSSEEEYLIRVRNALASLVSPRQTVRREREQKSRLLIDMKASFKNHGWLGKDIDAHQIVARHPLGQTTTADFALKNGCLHVIETVDMRAGNTAAKRTEAQAKAFTLHTARRQDQQAKLYAVMAGAIDNGDVLELMEDYADTVYCWEDPRSRGTFFETIAAALGQQ